MLSQVAAFFSLEAAEGLAVRAARLWAPTEEERWSIRRCIIVLAAACAAIWAAVFYVISLLL